MKYNFIFGCLIVLGLYTVVANASLIYSDSIMLLHFNDIIDVVRNSYPVFLTSDRAIWFFILFCFLEESYTVVYIVIFILSHNPRHWKRNCIMGGLLFFLSLGSTIWDLIFYYDQSIWWLRLLLYLPYSLFGLYQKNIYTKNSGVRMS